MICPNCGTNIQDGKTFCPNCGATLGASQQGQQNYANPQPQAPQNYGYMAPITQKNIALCIILSLVTCGIYLWYWIYTMTEDTNRLSSEPNPTSGGMVILLGIVTCGIYMWYWLYKRGDMLDRIKTSRGLPSSNSGVLYLILALVGLSIVSYALIQSEINKLATPA